MTDYISKNSGASQSGANVSPYASAEINHQKVPTIAVGTEIDRGNTTIWGETYYGGLSSSKFAGGGFGVQQTVFDKNKNSIYVGGQISVEKGSFAENKNLEKYTNLKSMVTIGYQREFNSKTSGYVELNAGVQNYKSNTTPQFTVPSYDATVGVERNFGKTRGRIESFAENFPVMENGKKRTENYVGVRFTLLF